MLEQKIVELEQELKYEQNMREYERNKYENLLSSQARGIAEHLDNMIRLELVALRDIAEHVPDDDRRRIIRRLDRIDQYLSEHQSTC